MQRLEFLALVEDTWRELDSAIDGLDEASMEQPGVVDSWSIKDLLGHVALWEQMALQHIDQYRAGETPTGPAGATIDDYNAAGAAERRDLSLARVLAETAATRQRLRAALESLSDDEWSTIVGTGDRQGPLGAWIGGALGGDDGPGTHATEHARQIRSWRDTRERGQPS